MHTIRVKRKITSSHHQISELKDFIGKHVEITVQESQPEINSSSENAARGVLSPYRNPDKIKDEKNAWKSAADEKHGNS